MIMIKLLILVVFDRETVRDKMLEIRLICIRWGKMDKILSFFFFFPSYLCFVVGDEAEQNTQKKKSNTLHIIQTFFTCILNNLLINIFSPLNKKYFIFE